MSEKLQTPVIRYLLQPLADIVSRIPLRAKTYIFYLSGLFYFCLYFAGDSGSITWRYLYTFSLSFLCFSLMAIVTLPVTIRPVRFRLSITICWLLYGVSVLQAGIFLRIDFLPHAITTLLGFPLLYLIWNNCDWRIIMDKLCRLCIVSLPICLAVSLLFFPMESKRYSALFFNENGAGAYFALSLSCLSVSLLAERRQLHFFFKMVLFGITSALLFYTGSRTGQLAAICSIVLCIIIRFIGVRKEAKSEVIGKAVAMLLSLIVFLFATFFIFRIGYLVKEDFIASLSGENVATEEDWDDALSLEDLESFFTATANRYNADGKDFTTYSTGRGEIWGGFLKELNLFGHADRISVPYYGGRETENPHNTVIAISYDFGVLAGLAYFSVNILSGVLVLSFAWKHRGEPWALLPLAVIVFFGVESMAESFFEIDHCSAMYYRFAMFPLFAVDWKNGLTKE